MGEDPADSDLEEIKIGCLSPLVWRSHARFLVLPQLHHDHPRPRPSRRQPKLCECLEGQHWGSYFRLCCPCVSGLYYY